MIENNSKNAIFLEESINNYIIQNNILNNSGIYLINNSNNNYILRNNIHCQKSRDAYFLNCIQNFWLKNYWQSNPYFIKIIFGNINLKKINIMWINLDLYPMKIPYEIFN